MLTRTTSEPRGGRAGEWDGAQQSSSASPLQSTSSSVPSPSHEGDAKPCGGLASDAGDDAVMGQGDGRPPEPDAIRVQRWPTWGSTIAREMRGSLGAHRASGSSREPAVDPVVAWHARQRRKRRLRAAAKPALVLGLVLVLAVVLGGSMSGLVSRIRAAAGSNESTASRTFASPSGNIVCALSVQAARCDIDTVRYAVAAVPPRCARTSNWGHVLEVGPGGVASLCPQHRRVQNEVSYPILAYGDAVELGPVRCRSEASGVSCERGAHGFTLSKGAMKTW